MNSEVCDGGAEEGVAGDKARAEADSLNQSTILRINDTEGR